MNHPCGNCCCPENVGGQCFGGGCRQNPAPDVDEEEVDTKVCAHCGKELAPGDTFLMVGDNYLQANFFETSDLNVFCSQNCLCEYLTVLEQTVGEEDGE